LLPPPPPLAVGGVPVLFDCPSRHAKDTCCVPDHSGLGVHPCNRSGNRRERGVEQIVYGEPNALHCTPLPYCAGSHEPKGGVHGSEWRSVRLGAQNTPPHARDSRGGIEAGDSTRHRIDRRSPCPHSLFPRGVRDGRRAVRSAEAWSAPRPNSCTRLLPLLFAARPPPPVCCQRTARVVSARGRQRRTQPRARGHDRWIGRAKRPRGIGPRRLPWADVVIPCRGTAAAQF